MRGDRRIRPRSPHSTHSLTASSTSQFTVGQGVLHDGPGCDRPGLEGAHLSHEPPKTWGFFAPRAASGRARLGASRARGTARAHRVVAREHRDDAMRAPAAPRAHPAPKRAPSPITPHPTLSTAVSKLDFIVHPLTVSTSKPIINPGRRCEARGASGSRGARRGCGDPQQQKGRDRAHLRLRHR